MMYSEVLQYPESPFVAGPLHRAPEESSPPYLEPVVLAGAGNIFTHVEGLPSWRMFGREQTRMQPNPNFLPSSEIAIAM